MLSVDVAGATSAKLVVHGQYVGKVDRAPFTFLGGPTGQRCLPPPDRLHPVTPRPRRSAPRAGSVQQAQLRGRTDGDENLPWGQPQRQ